jgi:hypothetical protein
MASSSTERLINDRRLFKKTNWKKGKIAPDED